MPQSSARRKLILAIAAIAAPACGSRPTPPEGNIAAALAIPTLDGAPFDPAAIKGKPALITFWRPGCPYCADALPKEESAAKQTGAIAIAIMISGGRDDARAELAKLGWTGPALDDHGALRDRFHVPHVPYTFVLRPDGTAARVFDGDEASTDDFVDALKDAR